MLDLIKKPLAIVFSVLFLGYLPATAQEVFPLPPAEAPILENSFRLDTSSGLWVRPLSVSGNFSRNLVDPSFVLKNYKAIGINEARRMQLIDLVANASAEMTRAEHLSAGVNDRLNELLSADSINTNAVMTSFNEVLDRENTLKRIRFQLMLEATSLLTDSEIETYQEVRGQRTKIFLERFEAPKED